jgi:2-polyprenyl-6-methoxyphenol hydroxylase-like FAD-dependent oxidoreductase
VGVLDQVRSAGWDIAPRPDGSAVAVAVEFGTLLGALARDLPILHEHSVVDLVRGDDGRVVGVEVEHTPGVQAPVPAPTFGIDQATAPAEGTGERFTIEADLVIACDGTRSPVRELAGMEVEIEPLAEASLGFMSPALMETSFAMGYMSDGGHIGVLGWPQGSAGWRSIPKMGREAALAPGLDAVRESWSRLLPESAPAVEGLTSLDQVRYSEPALLRTPRWWVPGVVLIGDAAHFFGPETGVSSGIGLSDAHALAEAIRQNPDDPDAACRSYETWRGPLVRPLEAMDPGRQRKITIGGAEPRPEERWPPEL